MLSITVYAYVFLWLYQEIMTGLHRSTTVHCIIVNSQNHKWYYDDITQSIVEHSEAEKISSNIENSYLYKNIDEEYITGYNESSNDQLHDHQYLISYGINPFGYSSIWKNITRVDGNSSLEEARSTASKSETRGKRGVTHLYSMVQCATGCNPLSYKGYGCYCGFLGSGAPTDPIDRCCQIHDRCYSNVRCPSLSVYVTPYLWRCWNGYPQCALGYGGYGGCSSQLCECDKQLAMCLSHWACPRRRALCTSSTFRLLQNLLLY